MAWPGGQAPQYSTDRRAAPEKGGHLPPITRLAAVKRGAGPFATGQTPAQSHCAWDVIPAPPFIQPRPPPRPRASFLFWTVHGPFACGLRAAASRRLASGTRLRAQSRFLLARKNWGPRAACRVGRGGRNGAERSPRPRRGRSGRSFFRRHGGCNAPAIAGIHSSPPEGQVQSVAY